ncbi:MAG: 3-deoxy-D-manno-octulosonic acid kinase [Gammaproteobacteria bacterium]|nr:3-deoxy-D-manno-octulosonic acid kinase [Gammaproteobacteria bacterium]
MNPCEELLGRERILYDADAIAKLEVISFDPRDLAERGVLIGKARGRGLTYFIRVEGNDWVLRHYQRGGLVARLLGDNYVWTGIERTRAWREWHMLGQLRERGLPVPRPIAARVLRHGPVYKADIITQRLLGTRTLADLLSEGRLAESAWRAVGACIRRFHNTGAYHADLNAHNVLLTQDNKVYLIDFDKSERCNQSQGWRHQNLTRLHRSLTKLRSLHDRFGFSESDWRLLCEGYGK